jgi:hypothetical protein
MMEKEEAFMKNAWNLLITYLITWSFDGLFPPGLFGYGLAKTVKY